jgi:hypothetical protein
LLSGFYSFLGFTRLTSANVLRRAIADGVQKGVFGYVGGNAPTLGTDGKYQVSASKIRFETNVADDEVDLDSGFIMLPLAIPQPQTTPAPSGTQGSPTGGTEAEPRPEPGGLTGQPITGPVSVSKSQTEIELTFSADRDQLFTAWNAVANLADLAGKVTVRLRAEKQDGFDKSKLQNGVIEPLKEADLIE